MKKKEREVKPLDTKKIIPIAIAVILAVVLLIGIVLGVITAVKELTAAVSYNGVTISEGVASYLAATFKQAYLRRLNASGINAYDGRAFWISENDEGKTYGELFLSECEAYIRSVAVSAYLFERNAGLTSTAREWIDRNVKEVLEYKADGNVAKFNEEAAKMGFTYQDFAVATELLYKAENAVAAIYGEDGSVLASPSNVYICEEFLKEYAAVKLIFIRLNDKFLLDDEGNRVTEGNRDKLEDLSSSEKAERQEDIENIKAAIENLTTGADNQMSTVYFDSFYSKYNDDPENAALGYYFSYTSDYSIDFSEMYREVVLASLELEVGGFDLVVVDEDDDGRNDVAVAIARINTTPYAYASSAYEAFFGDFYLDCASDHYEELLLELMPSVNLKDGYKKIDVIALPANSKFKIS